MTTSPMARDAAAAVVERAVQGIADALVILDRRGRKARDECAGVLRDLREDLATGRRPASPDRVLAASSVLRSTTAGSPRVRDI
jgi:hypothetical protein